MTSYWAGRAFDVAASTRWHTGSTDVGRLIVQAASRDLKQVSLELGGKSPNIILDDADVEAAIAGSTAGIFFNHGQCCNAGSRLFVQEKIFDKVASGIAANAAKIKLGVGLDPATEMGPMVSEVQHGRVKGYLKSGLEAGARALTGGSAPDGRGLFCLAHRAGGHQSRHESGARGNLRARAGRDPLQGSR